MEHYELIVIGTGPAGEKAAVKAAYFGHKVAIIEKASSCGGALVTTGLPSKALKETSLYYSGKYEKGLYGKEKGFDHAASLEDFMYRQKDVTAAAKIETKENLIRHGVEIFHGEACFIDPHTIQIKGAEEKVISADYILIATGSYPHHPSDINFDGKRVHDSDTILQIKRFPSSLCIVGAGFIGCEYATIFATMGCKVYLVNKKDKILPQIDQEVVKEFVKQMTLQKIEILSDTSVTSIQIPQKQDQLLAATLKNGEVLHVDMFLFAAGRHGNIQMLNLEKAGVAVDEEETVLVNKDFQTNVPHIYAAGDVIGFPRLANFSMEQGRVAVTSIFKTNDLGRLPSSYSYGIYTIPEMSMVGITEEEAKVQGLSYCTGLARYENMPRGKILGEDSGFLKLIFTKDDLVICGVHVIGRAACELIHYGISLIEFKQTLYDVIGMVFNFPTLHDLYKYAAYDALSNLSGYKVKS